MGSFLQSGGQLRNNEVTQGGGAKKRLMADTCFPRQVWGEREQLKGKPLIGEGSHSA